jgi:hypothetical protein
MQMRDSLQLLSISIQTIIAGAANFHLKLCAKMEGLLLVAHQ